MKMRISDMGKWRRFLPSRRLEPVQEPVTLGTHRIFILPTKAGMVFSILMLTMLLISINYNNPPGYLLTFLLTGVGIVSFFHTHRTLYGLKVSHAPSGAVFAGGTARFQVMVSAPAGAGSHGVRIGWSRLAEGPEQDVPVNGEARFVLPLPATARGRFVAGPIVVSAIYPLGLTRAWSPIQLAMSCIVYPKPEPGGAGWSPPPAHGEQGKGPAGSSQAGQEGEDFRGLRVYRPGDSPRMVAWKATARTDSMLSKEFETQEERASIWLRWEDADLQETEATLSRLCRWVLEAEKTGRPYGLMLPNQKIEPSRGTGHLEQCLRALALFALTPR